jgi:hypothetical protein
MAITVHSEVMHPFQNRFRRRENQTFLFQLCELRSGEKIRLIDQATLEEIDVLLCVLRLILKKEIPIKPEHFDKMKRSQRLPHLLEHFLDDHNFRILKATTLEKKKSVLRHITTYKELLTVLFY